MGLIDTYQEFTVQHTELYSHLAIIYNGKEPEAVPLKLTQLKKERKKETNTVDYKSTMAKLKRRKKERKTNITFCPASLET